MESFIVSCKRTSKNGFKNQGSIGFLRKFCCRACIRVCHKGLQRVDGVLSRLLRGFTSGLLKDFTGADVVLVELV